MTEEEKILERDLRDQVCYIGEDGDMVVLCDSPEKAFELFKQRIIDDCGEEEAEYLNEGYVIKAGFRLANKEDLEEYEDDEIEWLITYREPTKYEVYVYQT